MIRQNVLKFLINKNIPINHISIEKIIINKINKRFDLVVYERNGNVLLLENVNHTMLLEQKFSTK